MTHLLEGFLAVTMIAALVAWWHHGRRFRARLQADHATAIDAYARHARLPAQAALQHFARPSGYRTLDDTDLTRLGNRARLCLIAFSFALLVLLALRWSGV